MAKVNLDLGTTSEERYGDGSISPMGDKDSKQYPWFTVYVDLEDFPRKGSMTIDYEITRSVETEEDGKERCEYTVEVKRIVDAPEEVEAPTTSNSTGDILDALARALEHEKNEGNEENE